VSFVVDNSVALTWCFEDERTPATAALLAQLGELGGLAPMLWPLEAVNGLLVAERRGRLEASQRRRLAGFLHALPITLVFWCIQMIHCGIALLVFPAKAGTHLRHRHRPSPV
jgi:hypothetical protein